MTGTKVKENEIVFKIFGHEFVEGHWYTDDNEKKFMVVRATRI